MIVNIGKCIGCGSCAKDCVVHCIEIIDKKAQIDNRKCFKCGHCIAICHTNAVESEEYDMDEVIEYDKNKFEINDENLMNFIKYRRSVRRFKDIDVENEKIEKIIEAGRFTQTSTNSQDVSYIVVKENKDELKKMVLERLNIMGLNILNNPSDKTKKFEKYAKMWVSAYKEYEMNPKADRIFFNAKAVILVVSKTPINGGLASTNMELMTNALGLGTFYSGFLVRASQGNDKMREFLGLKDGEEIVTCLVVGYPDVKYYRTVPRKKAEINWK